MGLRSERGCRVSGPIQSGSLCTISLISGTIIIERAFMRHPGGYEGVITVEKDGFMNIAENSDTTPASFTIETFTDPTMDDALDAAFSGLEPRLACTYPCKTCRGSDTSHCLSCYTDSEFGFLEGGQCKASCSSVSTSNGNPEKVCEACDESCRGCFDKGEPEDKYRCKKCSSGFGMTFAPDNRCFKSCTHGYFQINPEQCGKCASPCLACEGD